MTDYIRHPSFISHHNHMTHSGHVNHPGVRGGLTAPRRQGPAGPQVKLSGHELITGPPYLPHPRSYTVLSFFLSLIREELLFSVSRVTRGHILGRCGSPEVMFRRRTPLARGLPPSAPLGVVKHT